MQLEAILVAASVVVATAFLFRKRKPSDLVAASTPVLNGWQVLIQWVLKPDRANVLKALQDAIQRRPDLIDASFFRITLWPFLNLHILNGPDGFQTMFNHRATDNQDASYRHLLGNLLPYPPEDSNFKTIPIIIQTQKSEYLEKYAQEYIIPSMVNFLKSREIQMIDGTGTIPDLVEAMYDLICKMACESLVGYTTGHRQDFLDRLQDVVSRSDAENLIKRNPLHIIAPSFVKKEREAVFEEYLQLLKEIVNHYVANHQDVLNLSGPEKKAYKDNDLAESVIRALWKESIDDFDFSTFYTSLFGLIFAAVANEFVVASLYIMHLSKNKKELELAREELGPVIEYLNASGAFEGKEKVEGFSVKILEGMPRLEAGVLETIRLGMVGFAPRYFEDEVTLKDGTKIPKGLHAWYFLTLLHRSESLPLGEPDEFNPSRFIVSSQTGELKAVNPITNTSAITFGYGRHPCAGMKFALLQIKFLSAMMLARWDFDFPDVDLSRMPLSFVGTARPAKGAAKMIFRKRF
ncbi:cytochrome P450 [Chytriomyces sp. MP71]|nr:cytochrome P450 [Chytriomyces sp. MP71]